jgi:hypothetical protein
MNRFSGAARPVLACAALLAATAAQAQTAPAPQAAPAAPVVMTAPAPAVVAAPAGARLVHIPEGTEVSVRFDQTVSSATASEGDRFPITLNDDVKLADGTVIPEGYKGVGEVTVAEKRGMMGKAGQLNVRFDYIRIGDTKVRLRGSKGQEGQGAVGATVVLTVLFGPLGLIKHGKDVVIQPGQTITAYVDSDTELATPLAPPPPAA